MSPSHPNDDKLILEGLKVVLVWVVAAVVVLALTSEATAGGQAVEHGARAGGRSPFTAIGDDPANNLRPD